MHPSAALGQLQPIPYQPVAPQPGADQMLLSELKGAGRVFHALQNQGVQEEAWAKLESLGQSSGPSRPEQAEHGTRLRVSWAAAGWGPKPPEAPSGEPGSRDRAGRRGGRATETESQGPPLSRLGEASTDTPTPPAAAGPLQPN